MPNSVTTSQCAIAWLLAGARIALSVFSDPPMTQAPAFAGPGSLAHDVVCVSPDLNAASARRFISSGGTSSTCVEIVQM